MPRYTVVIRANDQDRWVPGSWPIDVDSRDPEVVWRAAEDLGSIENVTVQRVVANSTGKPVPKPTPKGN